MKHTKENRRHKRLFFSPAEKVTCQLSLPESLEIVQVMVLDVSESGIGLSLKRGELGDVAKNIRLAMSRLEGWADIEFDPNLILEVKWVLDHEFLDRIACGCEFKNIPESYQQQLSQMIG